MRKYFFILLFLPFVCSAQIITTIVGNGSISNTGDGGPATAATIDYPTGGVFDKFGNYYFGLGANGCSVRKISPSGIITTVAGTNSCGYSGDNGPATLAKLKNVQAVAVDTSGNIYIGDADFNNRVRKVDIATGIITTIAGTGMPGHSGDGGPATAARILNPIDLVFDKFGNLYFTDGNCMVRKVNTSGTISTYAGNGIAGIGGTDVPATSVSIGASGLCFDNSGNLLIADNHSRVYKVNKVTGIISYLVGNGTSAYSGDGGLAINASTQAYKILMDKYDNLFIAEYNFGVVRMVNKYGYIYTIAGTGTRSYNGDNIPATSAELYSPVGLALDSCNNLYISDIDNYRIRKITYPHCLYLSTENERPTTQTIALYPIPASNELHIDNVQGKANYSIQNITGQMIQQGTVHNVHNVINVENVANGLYLLSVTDEQGTRVVRKFVKQ